MRAERMRALGEMARGIAHDFNNALNAILGQTGVLAALVGDRPAAAEALERLRKVALDGAATIRRVQEFSGQRRDRDFDRVDLVRAWSRVASPTSCARAPPPASASTSPPRISAAPVEGNAEELGELVRVLVDNALEAMPDGGTCHSRSPPPARTRSRSPSADTGVGMSPSVRRRALDPFFTTKGSRNKGLGLALAYGVVTRHGGVIELDSQLGAARHARAACACPPPPP